MFEFFTRWFKPKPVSPPPQVFGLVMPRSKLAPALTIDQTRRMGAQLKGLREQFGIPEFCAFSTGFRNQRPCLIFSIPMNSVRDETIEAFRVAAQEALNHTGLAVVIVKDTTGNTEAISGSCRPRSSVGQTSFPAAVAKFIASRTVRTA